MVTQNHPSGFLPSIHRLRTNFNYFIAAAFLSSTNQLVNDLEQPPRWCLVLPTVR